MHMCVSFITNIDTLFELCQMNFGQIFMLGLGQLIHTGHVLHIPIVSLDERLLVVHYVFVRRVFQPVYLNRSKMPVLNILNELQLL